MNYKNLVHYKGMEKKIRISSVNPYQYDMTLSETADDRNEVMLHIIQKKLSKGCILFKKQY